MLFHRKALGKARIEDILSFVSAPGKCPGTWAEPSRMEKGLMLGLMFLSNREC